MPILKNIFLLKRSSVENEKIKQKTFFPTFLTPGHNPPVIWPDLGPIKGELRAARKKNLFLFLFVCPVQNIKNVPYQKQKRLENRSDQRYILTTILKIEKK